jgi:hypothetical protein
MTAIRVHEDEWPVSHLQRPRPNPPSFGDADTRPSEQIIITEIGSKYTPFDIAMVPILRGGTLSLIANLDFHVHLFSFLSLINSKTNQIRYPTLYVWTPVDLPQLIHSPDDLTAFHHWHLPTAVYLDSLYRQSPIIFVLLVLDFHSMRLFFHPSASQHDVRHSTSTDSPLRIFSLLSVPFGLRHLKLQPGRAALSPVHA